MFIFHYMDSETIWTSVIIPIVVAPVSWILSKWYQNTQQLKYEKAREIYTLQKQEYEQCLNLFLYPVYFKLLLIYQLDFNIPDNYNYEEQDNSSDTSSEDSSGDENETIEKVRCIGYYKRESGQFHKCRHYVPITDANKVCKTCKWKYASEKINLRLDLNSNPVNNETSYSKRSSFRNRTESYIRVQMPDELPETQFTEHKIDRRLSKMRYLKTCIKTETIHQLNSVIIEHYREVKTLIESNIHVIKPTPVERNIYINLVRFIELKTILGCSDSEIQHDYGQKKNLVKVLSLVHNTLHRINEEYSNLILKEN